MRKTLYFIAIMTALFTVVACKSKAVINDEAAMEATSDLGSEEMTPTPEPETTSTDVAMNDVPVPTEDTSVPTSSPVESLGASSSGLGR